MRTGTLTKSENWKRWKPENAQGKLVENGIIVLILANIAAFMAGSVRSVNDSGANAQPNGALWVFEALSVAVFTVELLLGIYAAGQDPRFTGAAGASRTFSSSFARFSPVFVRGFCQIPDRVVGPKWMRAHAAIRHRPLGGWRRSKEQTLTIWSVVIFC